MTGNALTSRLAANQQDGQVTREKLLEMAEAYNRTAYVGQSGSPWFVGEKLGPDGVTVAFLSRHG